MNATKPLSGATKALSGAIEPLPEDNFEHGYQLVNYTLLERIGRGGEGVVWSAWDNRYKRIVALKIVPIKSGDYSADSIISADFERQVHLLSSLRHPNILPLYELGTTDEYYYFVMRYNPIGSLSRRLSVAPLSPREALCLAKQISDALTYLHARSIIHRDLKPDNILLDSQNRVYLSDFGLAKQLVEEMEPFHTGRGTGPYAPYEQHMHFSMSPQSDIFSLGIVIYEMLTGKLPWNGIHFLAVQQRQKKETLPDIPSLPDSIGEALRQLTAFNWNDRPETAVDAFNILAEAVPSYQEEDSDEVCKSLSQLDEAMLVSEDAQFLLEKALLGWNANIEAYQTQLTHLALIDSAATRPGQYQLALDDDQAEFVLRGALVYGYHLDYWWRRVTDYQARLRVCEQIIAYEADAAIGRALAQLNSESKHVLQANRFSSSTQEKLVDIAINSSGWALRNNSIRLLEYSIPQDVQWQPVGFTDEADAQLVTLALSDGSQARQAARLIGQVRSESAVQSILDAKDRISESHLVDVLRDIRDAAGGLPDLVPTQIRRQITTKRMRELLIDDREGLSLPRIFIGLFVGVCVSFLMMWGLFSQQDIQMKDVLLAPYPVSDIITIVEVTDESLARYGRWDAWPRSLHAILIDRLDEAGAGAIAFDFLFDSSSNLEDDAQLAEAMRRAGNIIQPVLGQGDGYHDIPDTVQFEDHILPQSELLAASTAIGHTNILHDEDGYVRRIPTIITVNEERYLSLPLAAIQVYLDADNSVVVPELDDGYLSIAGRQIPTGASGEMSIHYAGPPAQSDVQTFQTVSYESVLDGTVPPELIKDRIILIGITATSEPDNYLTPVSQGRPMYGVEILANVIESIWSGEFITYPSDLVRIGILLLLGVLTGLVCTRPWSGLIFAIGLAVSYFMLVMLVFDSQAIVLDILYPFMTIAFTYAIVTSYRFSIEIRRRREIMQLFEANVTPEVAKAALTAVKQGKINLGGQVQEVSILFVNIRGRQAFGKSHGPEEVMDMIKHFRKRVVTAVFQFEGAVAHYKGEQVMAIFNAPLPQSNHPWRAVDTAFTIMKYTENYKKMLPEGHPYQQVNFSFGIYTGQAIVGNVGSAANYAYTAIGDTVSIASHLANHAQPAQILIGDTTFRLVEDQVEAKALSPILRKDASMPIVAFHVTQK